MKTYPENFLNQVVFKIDFLEVQDITLDSIGTLVSKLEGLSSPQTIEQPGVVIEGVSDSEIQTKTHITQIFKVASSVDSAHFFEITKTSFLAATSSYVNYTTFSELYKPFLDMFLSSFKISRVDRLGLRYVNEIKIEESSDYYDWENVIDESLTSGLEFVDDFTTVRRLMQNMQIAIDSDTIVNFNYGIFNKTFPSPLVSKEFILDYDCSTPYGVEADDIEDVTATYNQIVSELFEKSIGDGLRERMSNNE